MRAPAPASLTLAILLSVTPSPALAEGAEPDPREAAILLYDQGRYADARRGMEALDGAGKADGSLLYRLAFCIGAAGDQDGQNRMMQRAAESLEKETASGGTIESFFYLSNVYRSLGRNADSMKAASAGTTMLEAGKWKEPSSGVDVFRVAKLYADAGRDEKASAWFRKAIEALKPLADRYPTYVRLAHRYLGDLASSRLDWETAANEYGAVVDLPQAQPQDLSKLAVARVRIGRYQEAADAWRRAEQLDPGGSDDARYSRQLALQALALGSLPLLAPDGRTWDKPSKDDLEDILIEQAKVPLQSRPVESGESSVDSPPETPVQPEKLKEAHRIFVAAGLEYATRGLPIRETAFSKGFAPLIFHPEEWEPKGPQQ